MKTIWSVNLWLISRQQLFVKMSEERKQRTGLIYTKSLFVKKFQPVESL